MWQRTVRRRLNFCACGATSGMLLAVSLGVPIPSLAEEPRDTAVSLTTTPADVTDQAQIVDEAA